MERRDFVIAGLAGTAAGLVSSPMARAQEHQHASEPGKPYVPVVRSDELKKVADTAHECVKHAVACIAECNRVLATGDSAMADCQQAVLSMVPVCEATAANATLRR